MLFLPVLIIIYVSLLGGINSIMPKMDEETEWSNSKGESINVKCSKNESKFQFLLGVR